VDMRLSSPGVGHQDAYRQQSVRLWELRSAMSLARLRVKQDRRAEARQLLAPVNECFTEGFETADLRIARAMLVEWL